MINCDRIGNSFFFIFKLKATSSGYRIIFISQDCVSTVACQWQKVPEKNPDTLVDSHDILSNNFNSVFWTWTLCKCANRIKKKIIQKKIPVTAFLIHNS